jgi:O-antigen/teichoic acid export membrane protein
VKDMISYSLGSFISGQSGNIPGYLMPILVTNAISTSATAHYFMAASISNILFLIPNIVTQNLLVVGSDNISKLKNHVKHAAFITFSLYMPAAMVLIFFGEQILGIFGKSYSTEGYALLQLFVVAGIVVCINYLFATILAIKKRVALLTILSVSTALLLVISSYFLLDLGIIGIGYASIIVQILQLTFYVFLSGMKKL